MKKIFILILCLVSLTLVGCKKDKTPPVDEIVKIEVCADFLNQSFYLNDVVSIDDYTVCVTYESNKTETIHFTSFGLTTLDTSSAGEKTINLMYNGKAFTIEYVVQEILPISAMFKGESLEFYRYENFDFSNIFVSVLFNNGDEENISLLEFDLGNIDYTLTQDERVLVAQYCGVSVNIPYVVTNRPIVEGVDYFLFDNLNIFNETSSKIRFVNGKYIVHRGEVLAEKPWQDATKTDFNRYWSYNNVGGQFVKIYFYLVNDTIYCEILE